MPMESEGPQTTHTLKKVEAQRRETAAQEMTRRQKESEDRRTPARKEAAKHNETHPKLTRQLEKRRWISEFSDRSVKRICPCHPNQDRASRRHRREPTRRKRDRSRRPRAYDRVAKRRERRPCTCSKCLKKPVCRQNIANYCVYVTNKRIGTDTTPLGETPPVLLTPRRSLQGSNHTISIHAAASSNKSISSYRSICSDLGQPPTVG